MKRILLISLAAVMLCGACTKNDNGENPEPGPGPDLTIWDGTSVTEPEDLNRAAKTATIRRASDLAWLSQESNASPENTFEGWVITLATDIDLNDKKWTPIAQWSRKNNVVFKGTFSGEGHTIRGLLVDNPGEINNGFFGLVSSAVIKYIRVIGTVRGAGQIGGICANVQEASIVKDCNYEGRLESTIDAKFHMGGICGWLEDSSQVLNCHSSPTIVCQGTGPYVGGVVGVVYLLKPNCIIRNCSFRGKIETGEKIEGNVHVGGIIGTMYATVMSGCKNSGSIAIEANGQVNLGGIAGFSGKTSSYIRACYNTGTITNNGSTGKTGGIVGDLDDTCLISSCYNTGTIKPADTEAESPEENREINFWKLGNAIQVSCYYKADVPELPGTTFRFSADRWPREESIRDWNIGNNPAERKYWKDLGRPGTEDYPALWWESSRPAAEQNDANR